MIYKFTTFGLILKLRSDTKLLWHAFTLEWRKTSELDGSTSRITFCIIHPCGPWRYIIRTDLAGNTDDALFFLVSFPLLMRQIAKNVKWYTSDDGWRRPCDIKSGQNVNFSRRRTRQRCRRVYTLLTVALGSSDSRALRTSFNVACISIGEGFGADRWTRRWIIYLVNWIKIRRYSAVTAAAAKRCQTRQACMVNAAAVVAANRRLLASRWFGLTALGDAGIYSWTGGNCTVSLYR